METRVSLNGLSLIHISEPNNPSVDLICEASLQPIIMYSEHQRIIQVMANLIHNAIKFTKSGEIRFGCHM